ncbi:hypothetical protein [Yoonia sp. R2-816]|uniref:hypothetical protein n=1 Tax=Yoonia sp. R2-816 TaxID=3342638 RepID=UPI00372A4D0D
MRINVLTVSLLAMAVTGCDMDPPYSPLEASGLVSVRPYPMPADVCQVIGENELTVEYLDDAAILIGCPAVETGAIADRLAEGAMQITQVGEWVLFSQPLR